MKSLTIRACLAIAVVGLSVYSSSQLNAQQNTLRWKLEEGQKFTIETTQTQSNTIGGTPMGDVEMEVSQDSYMDWVVKKVDGDKFTIGQTITRMKMSMDSAMMQMEYDSDDGEAEGQAAMIAGAIDPIIDSEITFVMDSKGNISDVEVPDDVKEALKGAGGGMGGMAGAPGPDILEQIAKQASLILPEEPVTGDSEWEHSTTQTTMVEMKVDSTFKYMGEEEDGGHKVHKIGVTSNVTLESNDLPGGAGSVELDKMEIAGTIWFDNENGYMTKSETSQTMSMLIEAMGQEIDMDGEVKIAVKVTPVKD